jgi:lipopolysaccharide/colanic/teichoic acid biosynthesis glycosyltransferase
VRYDLEYIRRQSLWEDLRIMLRTIPVVLFRRGGW